MSIARAALVIATLAPAAGAPVRPTRTTCVSAAQMPVVHLKSADRMPILRPRRVERMPVIELKACYEAAARR